MFRAAITIFIATLFCASLMPFASPARAQIGNIFSDRPRPPAAVAPRDQAPDDEEEEVPQLPQGRLLPTPSRPQGQGQGQGIPAPGSFQSQPLPPPPGAATAPPNQPAVPGQGAPNVATAPPATNPNPLPGLPSGQKQPRGTPPTPATLQPGDEVVTEPPAQKIVNKKAVFAGLDKITGRIIKFDADMGETVQFGALRIKPDTCYTRPVTASANTDSFVEVDEITLQGEVKRIFSGWMFAASPGLHGIEHPIYDIWLTDCKEPDTTVAQQETPKPVVAPVGQKKSLPAKPPSFAPGTVPAPRQPSPNPFPPFRQ